jgi:Icc-related predicted phosphoesterase
MKIGKTQLIPENIAPPDVSSLAIFKGNTKVCDVPLGRMSPSFGAKQYSFCALADIHLTYDTANEDFQRALIFAESNCDFTCIAGDLTNTGSDETQFALYKSIVDTYAPTKPVYAITGNHEHYNGYSDKYLEKYTGHPLYYSFTKGNDVFIMVGHYGAYRGDGIGWLPSETWSVEELQWLYETLEANRNKRCFVFTHVLPHEHGVGNPNNLYVTSNKPLLWYVNDGGMGQAFISLLRHYKNTILFHGHSHTRFWLQELDKKANYSDADGYRNVHIPSLSVPRDPDGTNLTNIYAESEGYIVDVYDDYIVLNGRDFIDNENDGHNIPIATYKIDTTLQGIEANTFTDSTGTINNI